ncbi:MAG: cysteine--tRNA ligase [Saprospiraceae bacterium]|nr:cysteine--tRNA ligase [Saprospiraceae bacterium]
MKVALKLYNSLTRQKEDFTPVVEGRVGLYVCGPTVYSDVHLGNCRTFISFDLIYRYLLYLGYKVRYVRNVTDVGHLEGDVDTHDAEDKISKKARLEQLEPMEIAQKYTNGFHEMMHLFNVLPPSIEPRATGHIPEQIEMVEQIIANGFGYEANGSVYFDVPAFIEKYKNYGQLSGRVVDDLLQETRDLKNQSEKRHPADFAIWMKASDEHIMKWNSPWSVGFPGWHLECSAMSTKYLGERFDIHGGGNDLKFPHHENEIAQNIGACGNTPANYWLHTNMLLLNGKKMSKSDGNNITPVELITGNSPHVSKGYSPMTVRFFTLQSHYSSQLDLTDEALAAAEKGFRRLMEGNKALQSFVGSKDGNKPLDAEIDALINGSFSEMADDFNAPKALAKLFELVTIINKLNDKHLSFDDVSNDCIERLKNCFSDFIFKIFGLSDESTNDGGGVVDGLMQLILDIRSDARTNKDWTTSDKIRNALSSLKIVVKDNKEGSSWVKE